MKLVKKIVLVILVIVVAGLVLTGINILQNGSGGWDGRSAGHILGVPAEKATPDDVERLSKAEVMQLFYASPAPEFGSMQGEYKAKLVPVGVMSFMTDLFTHHLFGPGRWEGKAFFPFEKDRGWGYNLFMVIGEDDKIAVARTRKMDTYVGKSNIDDRDSFHLKYSPYNTGMVGSMRDEIRKVNDSLYICMGYMAAGGGSLNPAPFILYGKPFPWVGPDNKE